MKKQLFTEKELIYNVRVSILTLLLRGIISSFLLITFLYFMLGSISLKASVNLFGFHHLVIGESNSMEPVLYPGDVVIIKAVDPYSLTPGDIITFYYHIPGESKPRLITHVFERYEELNGEEVIKVRRASSNQVDSWNVRHESVVGIQTKTLNNVGKPYLFFATPIGIGVLLIDIILVYFIVVLINKYIKNYKLKDKD